MPTQNLLRIDAAGVVLEIERTVAPAATGLVIIVDGMRRTRMSRRHRIITDQLLAETGLATLLLDVLTPVQTGPGPGMRWQSIDAGLMSGRICAVVDWAAQQPDTAALPVGILSSSGAVNASLLTAARRSAQVRALVGWDGRPNLAAETLAEVTAPTLLAVDGDDYTSVQQCEYAAGHLAAPCKLERLPAVVDFAEGSQRQATTVATAAAEWFGEHLQPNGDQ